MKKIIHLTVFLALIAALAGAALGLANNMTAPVIAKNELEAEKKTLKEIYPDASDDAFELVETSPTQTIEKIFKVEGKGYIYKMKVKGYKDGTSFLVALDDKGTVVDYVAISNGDTQGLGTQVTTDSFREGLQGQDAIGPDILNDTITGATISSKPVLEGIQEAAVYQAEKLK